MFAMSLFIINGKRLIGFHSIEFFLSYFGSGHGVDWAQPKNSGSSSVIRFFWRFIDQLWSKHTIIPWRYEVTTPSDYAKMLVLANSVALSLPGRFVWFKSFKYIPLVIWPFGRPPLPSCRTWIVEIAKNNYIKHDLKWEFWVICYMIGCSYDSRDQI